jgi:hypothetical protein
MESRGRGAVAILRHCRFGKPLVPPTLSYRCPSGDAPIAADECTSAACALAGPEHFDPQLHRHRHTKRQQRPRRPHPSRHWQLMDTRHYLKQPGTLPRTESSGSYPATPGLASDNRSLGDNLRARRECGYTVVRRRFIWFQHLGRYRVGSDHLKDEHIAQLSRVFASNLTCLR